MFFSEHCKLLRPYNVKLLGLATMLTICLGCAPDGPVRQAVSGIVTLDGKPVSDVVVVFSSTEPQQSGAAVKVIDGQFELDAPQGPSEGKFNVTFDTHEPDLEDFEQRRERGQKVFSPLKIHARYQRPGSITVDVRSDDPNFYEFKLRSQ